ncbi:MAG: hypothetical protein R6V83_00050 [Candidatus Thorarchaeota archaeon]
MDLAFTYVSQSTTHLTRYKSHEIQGMKSDKILTDSSKNLVDKALQDAMRLDEEVRRRPSYCLDSFCLGHT